MSRPINSRKRTLLAVSALIAVGGVTALVLPGVGTAAATAAPDHTAPTTVCLAGKTDAGTEVTVTLPQVAVDRVLAQTASYPGPCAAYGTPLPLGDGTVRSYAQLDGSGHPLSVGIVFPKETLQNLPTTMTDQHHCYDVNGDGTIDEHSECMGGHELPLDLPAAFTNAEGVPFSWALVNFNLMGHGPSGIYDVQHFDFHFYMQSKAARDAIRPGPCGLVMNCDDYATAIKPVPAQYMPVDYVNNDVAEVAMGNHLIDQTSPEWHNVLFTRTFIFGAYDSKLTFLEPMITKAYFDGLAAGANTNGCFPIKQPQQWQTAGWYPKDYCIRYRANRNDFTVSMENFQHS